MEFSAIQWNSVEISANKYNSVEVIGGNVQLSELHRWPPERASHALIFAKVAQFTKPEGAKLRWKRRGLSEKRET